MGERIDVLLQQGPTFLFSFSVSLSLSVSLCLPPSPAHTHFSDCKIQSDQAFFWPAKGPLIVGILKCE